MPGTGLTAKSSKTNVSQLKMSMPPVSRLSERSRYFNELALPTGQKVIQGIGPDQETKRGSSLVPLPYCH